ncbi:MAG: hypothetical protein SFX72_16215 [Isosphaeraceae bacterium]|nr:hypothetical protein [Isosphaeraceae bacterium]
MSYLICESMSVEKLRQEVEQLIRKGWRPQGGVAVVCSHQTSNWWFYQAMVHAKPGLGSDDSPLD